MADNGRGKRRRGEAQVIAALAAGQTYGEAAEAGGVGVRTVGRWMADPEFRGRVDGMTAAGLHQAQRILTAAMPVAAEQLVDMATAPASVSVRPSYVHLRALTVLIDRALAAHEAGVLEERVAALERRAGL